MSGPFQKILWGSVALVGLAGCSTYIGEERPAWRAQAENACLARGAVQESTFIRASREISGPGICGLTHPFKVTALAGGSVTLNATQTVDCPMIEALDAWIKDVVQPAALARFGEPIVRINTMGSYSCRGINNMSGAHLSEHAFGNALDIGGFVLASGRELNIMRGFNGGEEQERAFLHEAHAGACGVFTTVLGPGYNIFHYNHFHVDLAMHGSTSRGARRYCKPVPQKELPEPPKHDDLPDPPAIEEEMDIARAAPPAASMGSAHASLLANLSVPQTGGRAAAYSPASPRQPLIAPSRDPDTALPRRRGPAPVTFAVEEPAPQSTRRRVPMEASPADSEFDPNRAPRPAIAMTPDGEQGMSGGADAEPPGSSPDQAAAEPSTQPRPSPAEGRPADWDITSSVAR